MAAFVVILLLAAGFAWRVVSSREVIDSVPLSTGQYNIRFLAAGVGSLKYTSDTKLKEILRPRLPGAFVKKLGDVTTVSWGSVGKPEFGDQPLIMLFQLLSPQNAVQPTTSSTFSKIEFPESTGFVFTEDIRGYSSHGQGTSFQQLYAFPRRDPQLSFRLYELNGKFLMERSFPNPAWKPNFPVWTPEPLPATTEAEGLKVTVRKLNVDTTRKYARPVFEVESNDPSWLEPTSETTWTDATGNVGQWLSPFEPAWKLHLRLRRRAHAEFPVSSTWKVDSLAVPPKITTGVDTKGLPIPVPAETALTIVDKSQIVDGIGLKVRYVAPAAKIREEDGKITVSPPSNPGRARMGISSGTTTIAGGKMIRYSEIDVGTPYIRLEHDPLPPGVELICNVRDENGVFLNDSRTLPPGRGGMNGVSFYAVYYKPVSEAKTKSLNLEVRVSRPKDFEFIVAPPPHLRKAIKPETPK